MKSAAEALFRALKWNTPPTPRMLESMGKRHPQHCCQWPECDILSSMRMSVGVKEPLIYVCPEHSRQFRRLGIVEFDNMTWQPKRAWK